MRGRATLSAFVLAAALSAGEVQAGPALLLEADTGRVLYAQDPDSQWYPASLTKIMTAYMTFQAIKAGRLSLDTKIVVSEAAHAQPPSKVGLPVGAEMTVELALQAVIVKSANDVAVMLGEAIGGTEAEFVKAMNATARRLGMSRTTFANANGLPAAEQVTTARDLARLSRAVIRDFPEYAHYWQMADMRIGRRRLGSHNTLLKSYEGADGLKTGFICDSGFNVVATASRDGKRLVAVVLGETSARDRAVRASSLLEHGFQTSGWKQLFNTQTIDNLPPSTEAKGAISIRDTIKSWDCNPKLRQEWLAARAAQRKERVRAAKARLQQKDAKEKAAANVEAGQPATGGVVRGTIAPSASTAAAVANPKPAVQSPPAKPPQKKAVLPAPAAAGASAPKAAPITTAAPKAQ